MSGRIVSVTSSRAHYRSPVHEPNRRNPRHNTISCVTNNEQQSPLATDVYVEVLTRAITPPCTATTKAGAGSLDLEHYRAPASHGVIDADSRGHSPQKTLIRHRIISKIQGNLTLVGSESIVSPTVGWLAQASRETTITGEIDADRVSQ